MGLNVCLDLVGHRAMRLYPESTLKAIAVADTAWTKLLPAPFRTVTLQTAPSAPWPRLGIDTLAFSVWHRLSPPIREELEPDFFLLEVVSTQPDLPFTLIVSRAERSSTAARRAMSTPAAEPVQPAPVGFVPPPAGHVASPKSGASFLGALAGDIEKGAKDVVKVVKTAAKDVAEATDDVLEAGEAVVDDVVDGPPTAAKPGKNPKSKKVKKKPAKQVAGLQSSLSADARKAAAELETGALHAEEGLDRGINAATKRANTAAGMLKQARGYQDQIASELDLTGKTAGRKATKGRSKHIGSMAATFDVGPSQRVTEWVALDTGIHGRPSRSRSRSRSRKPSKTSTAGRRQHLSDDAYEPRFDTSTPAKVTEWTPFPFVSKSPTRAHSATGGRKTRAAGSKHRSRRMQAAQGDRDHRLDAHHRSETMGHLPSFF